MLQANTPQTETISSPRGGNKLRQYHRPRGGNKLRQYHRPRGGSIATIDAYALQK